jgi:hypothetical protein
MVAMRLRRTTVLDAAEGAPVLAGCVPGNLPVAHSLASGLGAGASDLRLSGRRARL